jgi:predicted dithiol-disulfide oxidoreductase (DUF899 family)
MRFPNESAAYRTARDALLDAEIALRRQIESVAAMRRKLPVGGAIPVDYEFVDAGGRRVRMSQLFERDAPLVVYSFMYGPEMRAACPSCTSILDALDGEAPHIVQRVNLAVAAKSPIERILAHARDRGWRNLRLLSSAHNGYNRDYHGEDDNGAQQPALNVFVRSDGAVRHTYGTELLGAKRDAGQDPRHVDAIWPLWSVFDYTPEGRGDFYPQLRYS